jgi:hypothetical protein
VDHLGSPLVQLLTRALRFYFRFFEGLLRGIEVSVGAAGGRATVSAGLPTAKPRDERIAKIDVARDNLQDALSALGELKAEAEQNKVALDEAIRRLDETKAGHAKEAKQLRQIRAIAEADIATFRRMAGINPARERFVGFLGGVAASLLAAGLWKLGEFIFS